MSAENPRNPLARDPVLDPELYVPRGTNTILCHQIKVMSYDADYRRSGAANPSRRDLKEIITERVGV
jgi:hypothetical protein